MMAKNDRTHEVRFFERYVVQSTFLEERGDEGRRKKRIDHRLVVRLVDRDSFSNPPDPAEPLSFNFDFTD